MNPIYIVKICIYQKYMEIKKNDQF